MTEIGGTRIIPELEDDPLPTSMPGACRTPCAAVRAGATIAG